MFTSPYKHWITVYCWLRKRSKEDTGKADVMAINYFPTMCNCMLLCTPCWWGKSALMNIMSHKTCFVSVHFSVISNYTFVVFHIFAGDRTVAEFGDLISGRLYSVRVFLQGTNLKSANIKVRTRKCWIVKTLKMMCVMWSSQVVWCREYRFMDNTLYWKQHLFVYYWFYCPSNCHNFRIAWLIFMRFSANCNTFGGKYRPI